MYFDAHADLLYDVARRRLAGERRVLERRHLDRLRRGNVEGVVLAFWVGAAQGQTFWKDVRGAETDSARLRMMMECAGAEFAECPWLQTVWNAQGAEEAKVAGRMYAFLAVEGMAAIGGDLTALDRFRDFGVRIGMLTWNEENALAAGVGGDPSQGLTALGRKAVARMESLGMVVDVSHLNEKGFWDVLGMAQSRVIASHSNCRALCDVPRNLTDSQLRAIRDSGGVVGLNTYDGFVHRDPPERTVRTLARHAAHMAEVMGVEHVGCGFDFCHFMGSPGNESVQGLEDASKIGELFCWLEKFGMSAREREMIARENFLRVLA